MQLDELEKFAPGKPLPAQKKRAKKFQDALDRLNGVKVGDILVLPGDVRWKVVAVDLSLCRVIAQQLRGSALLRVKQEIAIMSARKE